MAESSPVLGAIVARRIHGYQHNGQAQCDGRGVSARRQICQRWCPVSRAATPTAASMGMRCRTLVCPWWPSTVGVFWSCLETSPSPCYGGSEVLAEVGGGPQCAALHISTSTSIVDIQDRQHCRAALLRLNCRPLRCRLAARPSRTAAVVTPLCCPKRALALHASAPARHLQANLLPAHAKI
jgi:hypothetical protein